MGRRLTRAAGDYAQAMMDLGATICTPRRPACVLCPLAATCVARISGRQDVLPLKLAKAERPVRRGSVFYVTREPGEVLVRTRPPRGLFGGMAEFPGSDWNTEGDPDGLRARSRRIIAGWPSRSRTGSPISNCCSPASRPRSRATLPPQGCRWVAQAALAGEALPSLMRKVAAKAAEETGR